MGWVVEGGGHLVSMNIMPRKEEWVAPIVGGVNPSPGALPVGKAHSQVWNFPKIQIQWLGTPTMATSYRPYLRNTPPCWLPHYSVYSMSLDCCRGGSVRVGSHEAGAPKGLNLRVFLNLRRTHEYMNLPLCKQLSFDILTSFWFPRKDIFPKGPWEHIMGERYLLGGDPSKYT